MMRRNLFFILGFILVGKAGAATKYVFQSAPCTNTAGNLCDGSDWNHAWKEFNQIDWAKVGASDVIKVSGGPTGLTYTTGVALSKSGDPVNRLRIERATESGHDGKVILKGSFNVTGSYITVDGKNKDLFEFYNPNSTYFSVNTGNTEDYFELKNVFIHNTPNPSCWARSIDVVSGSLSIENSELYRSQCSEDIIRFAARGRIKIERTYIHGWESLYVPGMGRGSGKPPCPSSPPYDTGDSLCWSHSDGMEGGGSGHSMLSLIFRNNLVDDEIPSTELSRGGNILFMTGYTAWGDVEIQNNVFKGIYQAFQSVSVGSMKASNNVFYNTHGANFGGTNNIYDSDYEVVWNGATYSMWSPRTPSFVTATGNFKGNPGFVNPGNILGADNQPFTADDGFALTAGSPAINKGTTSSSSFRNVDILGRTMSGIPDLGAYEFDGTNPPSGNSHPADTNTDFLISLNEATTFGACWKTNCNANATLDNASRAGFLWKASATGQYQYNSNATCPLCWEVKP